MSLSLRRFEGSPNSLGSAAEAPQGPIHPAELQALREIDVVALPELLELAPTSLEAKPAAADRLRLPPPPVRAHEGQALFTSMGRAVECFDRTQKQPVSSPEAAVLAEAKMIGLIRGIHGLEQEIRQEIARRRRA